MSWCGNHLTTNSCNYPAEEYWHRLDRVEQEADLSVPIQAGGTWWTGAASSTSILEASALPRYARNEP